MSVKEENDDENTWMIRRHFFRKSLFTCKLEQIIKFAIDGEI